MGETLRFRLLREARPLPTPHFLRPGTSQIGRLVGFLLLAAFLVAAWAYAEHWYASAPGGPRLVTNQPKPPDVPHFPYRIPVFAIDGDSLRYGGEEIRLLGIDAPEFHQTCLDERRRRWDCGRAARDELERLVARGAVQCRASGRDRYGRALAVCSAGRIGDLGEAMVRQGYAIDYMGGRYTAAEAEARAARRGLWRGEFERPQDWRRANPRMARTG
jgi:endonuclease YncB( thermonuclease family)